MKIQITQYSSTRAKDPERRHFNEVLGTEGGASRRGSTFWKGVRLCPRESGLAQAGVEREGFLAGRVALDLGLVFHHALEVYYDSVMAAQQVMDAAGGADIVAYCVGPTADAERAAWEAVQVFAAEPGYEDIFETVQRMLTGYFEFYRLRDRFRILGVEETFDLDGGGFEYSARLDVIIEDLEHGGMWVLEHKSATTATESLLTGYQMDLQVLGQVWLIQNGVDLAGLPPFKGVRVNICTKGSSRKPPEMHRVDVCPSHDHLAMFEEAMRSQATTAALWKGLGWPKHLGACNGGGRYFATCPYFTICHSFPLATVEQIADAPPFGFTSPTFREDT